MNQSERYINTHFRSMLISRFNYSNVVNLVKIRGCKILAIIPPSHFEVMSLILFLGTGVWPYSKIFIKKKRKKGGKYFLLMLVLHISKLWQVFGNIFLWKASEFYFPVIDAADPGADYVFLMRSLYQNASIYHAPYLVEGFVELMHMLGYSARIVKGLTTFWNVKWIFATTPCSSIAEHTMPMRAYSFGSTNIIPFVSVFDKQRVVKKKKIKNNKDNVDYEAMAAKYRKDLIVLENYSD